MKKRNYIKNVIFMSLFFLLFFGIYVEASVPKIGINVVSMPDIANNYGGVDIDVSISDIENTNYVYEIKRSEDAINWQNIGLAFDYSFSTCKVIPKKLKVLNVYPDNDSFTMPAKLREKYSKELIATLKNVYAVQTGTFIYNNNVRARMPRSSMLKIWMEGGSYIEGIQNIKYPDLSYYNGNKLYEIEQISMKNFNSTIKDDEQLEKYDVLFFGTWDANAWNDLSDSAYLAVRDYIVSGHGVIFGHDTVSYEIISQGRYSNQCEADNFFKLRSFLGFTTIPAKYENASLFVPNSSGFYLPLDYQIWGGNNSDKTVKVRFSKSKITTDSALPTFPYDLLGEDGKPRELNVPITHTSWMGLEEAENNIVSFAKNEYEIIPEVIRKKYNNNPSYKYNWYLCSGKKEYSCYSIQTGHMKNASSEDERKLIANVICSAYKNEKVTTINNEKKSKIDTSAQDYKPPKVFDVELDKSNQNSIIASFTGEDFGTDYYYYAKIKSLKTGRYSSSDIVKVTVTTGIKNYYYIVDSDSQNKDFDVEKSVVVNAKDNEAGFAVKGVNESNVYLHVKAIDYAGNESKTIVIDLSDKIKYFMQQLQIKTDNAGSLYKTQNKNGIRHYFVNGNNDFYISGGCDILPFATTNIQPYGNIVNGLTLATPLDLKIGENKNIVYSAGKINEAISIKSVKQCRTNKSSALLFNTKLLFLNNTNGKEIELKPYAIFLNNERTIQVSPENEQKLIVTCDQNAPIISVSGISSWYNGNNYKDGFVVDVNQNDDCSGIRNGKVSIQKYENSVWKTIDSRIYTKTSQKFSFLNYAGEGIYRYEIASEDNVGNISNMTKIFSVDRTPPVVNGLQNEYGWTNKNVKINISSTDNMSGVSKISLYNKNNVLVKQSFSSGFEYEFVDEQNTIFYVVAEDNVGNVSEKYFFTVKIDKTRPDITGANISDNVLSVIDGKDTYYIPDNKINICASDNNEKGFCSGIVCVSLKNQENQDVKKIVNNNDSTNLYLEFNVTDFKLSDFYCVVASDVAGNVRKIYIVPECCQKNRIRRYINHDNYEKEYGYFRVYE